MNFDGEDGRRSTAAGWVWLTGCRKVTENGNGERGTGTVGRGVGDEGEKGERKGQ